MKSFWDTLPRPFFVMAPMADVTDPAFRKVVAECGRPDVTWTEFVSADGLYHTREIAKMPDAENPLFRDLAFTEGERPIVAQFFGSNADTMEYVSRLAVELGFDGVDINMGCPDKSIEKQGSGAAMICTPELAVEIIHAAIKGTEGKIPVSVKTRIGFNKENLDEWLPVLLTSGVAAITLHLRTRKEMSKVPAHWDLMTKAVEIRNRVAPHVLLLGNGDVKDLEDAKEKVATYGCDGVMIGRGIFGNPWVFAGRKSEDVPLTEKLHVLIKLAHDFEALTPKKHFHILKKHFKAFVTGFDGAVELRAKMMETETAEDLARTINAAGLL